MRKPVVETLYRDKTIKETTYETVTKYRDEEYTVREPVVETEMRTEEYTVKKPVTEKMIEVKSTTTYEPVVTPETRLVSTEVPVIELGARPDPNARPRIKWLDSGNYTDPATGLTVFRRRGLHWVQPTLSAPAASLAPALVPQQYGKLSYVPKTVEERNPIEVTRYVEEVKTRKVPVEVKRMVEKTKTRRVAYEVEVPKETITTVPVPYKRTTYKEEMITRMVPYEKTVLKKIETTEPYEVEVPYWISETREIEVPKTVSRKVQHEVMRDIPRTVMMKVPLNVFGQPVGSPMPLDKPAPVVNTRLESPSGVELSIGTGTTLNRRVEPLDFGSGKSVLKKPETEDRELRYQSELKMVEKELDETSLVVPKTTTKKPATSMGKLDEPTNSPNEITHPSQITNRIPRASQWQSDDPFGDYVDDQGNILSVDEAQGLQLDGSTPSVVVRKEPVESSPEVKTEDAKVLTEVPGASKPELAPPTETGDENADLRMPKL